MQPRGICKRRAATIGGAAELAFAPPCC